MGEVYIAQDETLGRSVALKILPPGLVRNEERVRRFVTEAKSASSLNHPNIVTIYEIGHDEVKSARGGAGEAGAPAEMVHFISMELVAGQTLDEKIHQERADLRTLLGYLAQAAEGIAKAHQAGIVHRDLKPGNVMVSKDGFAKVLDFGLAKLTERGSLTGAEVTSAPTEVAATGAGVVMGTVGYMSPEQVQARTVDHRSDIFSLGCILYEAATRRRPFVADSDIEVMHQIIKEKPPAVESINPDVPGEVRRLIRRCLAKAPDQRFQSMKDLAIDLRELVEEWDSLSPSAPSGSTSGSGATAISGAAAAVGGRGKVVWAAIAVALVIGIGGLGFGLFGLMRRGGPAGGAGASANAQDLRMSVLMSRDDLVATALSEDGRYLAYVTVRDRKATLNVRQVRTGSDVVILPDSETRVTGISFSPDGDYLYYLNRDPDSPNYSALYQVASLGGTPRKLIFDVDSAVTFSPDGRRICFRRGVVDVGADSLIIADLGTAKEKELLRIKNPDVFNAAPVWSPDGRTVAVAIQNPTGGVKSRLVSVDVASGTSAQIGSRVWLVINSLGWMPDGRALLVSALDLGAGNAFQVYRVAYPGGEAMRLTNDLDGYTNLSIAADGSSVAAVRRATVDNLWVARVSTRQEPQPITFASGSAGSVGNLVPLPGGATAFTAPKDNKVYLWRIEADGSHRTQLTSQGIFVINAGYARGAGLVFTQVDAGDNAVAHIWRMDPDGGGLRQLTEGNGEELIDLSTSGNALIFQRWDDPRSIWSLKLDGTPPMKIVDGKAAEDSLISPDGTCVLTAVFEEVKGRLFPRRQVIPIEGGAPQSSFLLPPGSNGPAWTPDGRAVTYVDQAEGWNLMRRAIPDGKPERLTRFTEGQVVDHAWSPDGSRMVIHHRAGTQDSVWMLKPGESAPTLITEFKTGRLAHHFWAPDAPILYFTYGSSSQDVVMIAGIN